VKSIVIHWARNVTGKELSRYVCEELVRVGVVIEVRDDLISKEEKNEKLQVQPNWRSGQIVLK
jgi:hypothetical protein